MKRILFSALGAAALLVTGCAKDDLDATMGNGEMANVSLSVAMGSASGTRAKADYGTGTTANRVILEVYASNGELYKRMVAAPTAMTAEFDLRLVTSQEYQFVAWADYSAAVDVTDGDTDYYYNTDGANGLKGITVDYSSYLGSDEMRDAFYGQEYRTVSGATTVPMTLTRPFGQLNLFTDLTDVIDSKCPQGVRVMYSTAVANKFDASTGETAGSSVITWASTPVDVIEAAKSVKDAKGVHLATDYILAPAAGEQLVDFNVSFFDGSDTKITNNDKFVNIPIKRNFRTNVSGELLTADGEVNMTIVPGFLGESDVNVTGSVTVATVADAQAFLDSFVGTDNVNITIETVTDSEKITVPSTVTTNNVTIVIEGVSGTPVLTVETETAGDVTIDNQSGTAMGLDVDAENASVYVSGSYNSLSIICSPSTVYIEEGAVVDLLTVNKGNVVLYGEAKSIVRGADNTETVELTAYGTLGTIGDGVDLVDGTILYNVTTNVQYSDLTSLVAYGNISDDDVLFVGAGVHTTTSGLFTPQDKVTIYGPNRGVAATSTERKAEAQIAATLYRAQGSSISPLDVTIDGVEFVDNAGFYIEGGSNLVVKNTIISSTGINCGSESDRILFTNGTYHPSVITLENNWFKAVGGSALQIRTVGQRISYDERGDTSTKLVMNNNTFVNYNFSMGAYEYSDDTQSSFTVTNNSFTNTADTEVVLDLFDESGAADAYSHFAVLGNTFNEGQVGINVGFVPENYDPTSTSAIELANSFNGVAVNVETPKFFNMTSKKAYADFSTLMAGVAANDVVYVGAGDYALGQLGKNVTIYGANKGVAGDADRKPETRFISGSIYKAPTNATVAKINLTIDGVELTKDFTGISLQGGGTFTLKNSRIIDINKVNVNNSSTRFFYTDCSRTAGTFVIENNYFALGGGIKELWAYGNKYAATKYDTPINMSIKGNVFDSMYLNLGISANDGMSFKSSISVENNTFRNIAGTYAVWFTPSSGVIGSTMYANGNTFEGTVTSTPYVYVNGAGSATTISGDNIASK